MYAIEKKLNNTPFVDVLEAAERVFDITATNGGGTFIYLTPIPNDDGGWCEYHGDGYAVGGYQDTVKVDLNTGNGEPVLRIAEFIQRIPSTLNGDKHYLLGTWIEDGVLYIDAVKIWAEEGDAMNEARKNGEKAIYHFNSERTIYVEPEVELEPIDHLIVDPSPTPVLNDHGDVIAIDAEGKRFVPIDDVIAFIEAQRDALERLANNHPEDSLTQYFRDGAKAITINVVNLVRDEFSK